MKVISAKHIGFCFGVKRAVALAENSLKQRKKPIWFLGELVHNEQVLEKFKRKNVKFIESPKKAKSGILIIQAHGFPPLPERSEGWKMRIYPHRPSKKTGKKLLIRDATCPLVKKTQLLASYLYKKGYQLIIVGDKNHSETKGIKGFSGKKAVIVESEEQAKKLPKYEKIGAVAQTTQGTENFKKILKILKDKAPELKWFDTLCPEVNIRQQELREISKKCEGLLIIGSKLSANTKRLVQIAKKLKDKVFQANSVGELKKKNFKGISVLGMVSGTSAPGWEIKKIKKWLNSYV